MSPVVLKSGGSQRVEPLCSLFRSLSGTLRMSSCDQVQPRTASPFEIMFSLSFDLRTSQSLKIALGQAKPKWWSGPIAPSGCHLSLPHSGPASYSLHPGMQLSTPPRPFWSVLLLDLLENLWKRLGEASEWSRGASRDWLPGATPILLLRFTADWSSVRDRVKWQLEVARESLNHTFRQSVSQTGFSSQRAVPSLFLLQSFRVPNEEFLSV